MIDPFTAWTRMVSAGLEMQETWLRGLETVEASRAVIGARTAKIRAAASAPLTADHAEFARMVPEKIEAFGRSAEAVARDTMAMHAAWSRQLQRVAATMLAGRPPTVAETIALAAQGVDYALGAMTAGARLGAGAIAPVHRTATGNARRLARSGAR